MLLSLPIVYKCSGVIGTVTKEINENYLDAHYQVNNFFGKELIFFIEKYGFDEENNKIIVNGSGRDIYSLRAKREFYIIEGIELSTLGITIPFLKDNVKELEKLGFKVELEEKYIDYLIRRDNHEESRTKFQRFFGLNKFHK